MHIINNLNNSLKLLAFVTHPNFSPKITLRGYIPVLKDFCFEVETLQMVKLRQLEGEMTKLKKSYDDLQTEVIKLRYKAIPVTVDVMKEQ